MHVIRQARNVVAGLGLISAIFGCAPKRPVQLEAPVSVSIEPVAGPSTRRVAPSPSHSFWEGMRNLDPGYADRNPVSPEEARFANALRLVLAGDANEAELTLDSLRSSGTDSLVRTASWILLTAMLQYQDKWDVLAEIAPRRSDLPAATERNRAAVEQWAAVLGKIPRRVISIPSRPTVAGLTLSVAGTPVVSVLVNGKQRFFWLDTGSSISIVASDVAADAGVIPLSRDTLEIVTATGRIPALPSVISRLQFAGVSITNAKAMIVDTELMQVRSVEGAAEQIPVRIDGIVGFDVLSRMRVRLDYGAGTVTVAQPSPPAGTRRHVQRNFFWVGTPMVRLLTARGVPLHFVLDTGAQETYATEILPVKAGVRTYPGERRSVAGLAGGRQFRGRFINDIRLWLGARRLDFRQMLIFAPAVSSFATWDGILGSDIARTAVVTLDASDGLFTVEEPSRGGRRLREGN